MKGIIIFTVVVLLIAACQPEPPFKIHCIDRNLVPEGTELWPIREGAAYGEESLTAEESRYCYTGTAHVGNGRLERIATDRITLDEYLVQVSCVSGDTEVAAERYVQRVHKYWDKLDDADRFTSSGRPELSLGNYCYSDGKIVYTDNYTGEMFLSPLVYQRLYPDDTQYFWVEVNAK